MLVVVVLAIAGISLLVVFIQHKNIKTTMPDNVVSVNGSVDYILTFRQEVFSNCQFDIIVDTIDSNRLAPGFLTFWRHYFNVKKIIKSKHI